MSKEFEALGFIPSEQSSPTQSNDGKDHFAELGFIPSENQPRTNPQVSSDQVTQQPTEAAPFNTEGPITSLDQAAEDPIAGRAMSVVSGLSNAGANVFEGGVNAITWLGEKLNAISPEKAAAMKRDVNKFTNKNFRSGDETSFEDPFNKARMNYPGFSAVPQAASEVGMLAKIMPPAISSTKLGKLGTSVLNLGAQTGSNALTAAGMAGPNTEDQDRAAMYGAMVSPALAGVGKVISHVAKKSSLINKLKEELAPINKELAENGQLTLDDKAAVSRAAMATKAKEIGNQNWDSIKNIPGTIESSRSIAPLKSLLKSLPRNDDKISIVNDIKNKIETLSTMDDAIKLKQMISRKGKYFNFGSVADDIAEKYKAVHQSIDDAIQAKATGAGLKRDWALAKKYHHDIISPLDDAGSFDLVHALKNKESNPTEYADVVKNGLKKAMQSPQQLKAYLTTMDDDGSQIIQQKIIKDTLDEVIDNPDNFKGNTALIKLNKAINKYDGVLSKDSIKSLRGIKLLMEDSGIEAKSSSIGNNSYALQTTGAMVGGAVGSAVGGWPGGAIGSAIGVAAGPALLKGIGSVASKLLDSVGGATILKGIAEGKPWAKEAAKIIRAGVMDSIAKSQKSDNQLDGAAQ